MFNDPTTNALLEMARRLEAHKLHIFTFRLTGSSARLEFSRDLEGDPSKIASTLCQNVQNIPWPPAKNVRREESTPETWAVVFSLDTRFSPPTPLIHLTHFGACEIRSLPNHVLQALQGELEAAK